MIDHVLTRDTTTRLLRYSAAAGLGAFAFGQPAPNASAAIFYTDLGGIVLERGDQVSFDLDGDGYNDFRLANTDSGGIGGIGFVQFQGSIDPDWYGAPGTNPNYPNAGASYAQTRSDWPGGQNYYVRSFVDGDLIGPSNPNCVDTGPDSTGHYYGRLSQYPGWDQHSFWCPVVEPWASNGSIPYPGNNYTVGDLPDDEYGVLRIVDSNDVERWAWVRFQVIVQDTGNQANKFPMPDGYLTWIDYVYDLDRQVILYDMAIEMAPDTDIIAGDNGCGCWDGPCWGDNPCKCADLNRDCYVGLGDLDIVLLHWNEGTPPSDIYPPFKPYPTGDINGDGFVGLADLDIILSCWNEEGTLPATEIPEPGCLGLLAAGAGALVFKRRC